MIDAESTSQARLLLGKQYGEKNVVSVSRINLDEQQTVTATPSQLKHEKVVSYLTNKITRIKNRPKITQQDVHKAVERYKTRQKRANLELEKQQATLKSTKQSKQQPVQSQTQKQQVLPKVFSNTSKSNLATSQTPVTSASSLSPQSAAMTRSERVTHDPNSVANIQRQLDPLAIDPTIKKLTN
jgi:hypothetical protein